MAHRPPVTRLAAKLARVSANVQAVARDAQHDHFNFSYASPDAVFEAVRGPLAAENIALIPLGAGPVELVREIKGDKSTRRHVRVPIRFAFVDGESGERIDAEWFGEGIDAEASAASKAMTNALRTLLRITFQIPQLEDDHQPRPRRAPRPQSGPAMITTELYNQLNEMFQTAGAPAEQLAAFLSEQGVDVEVGLAPAVAALTLKQGNDALVFLRGLGTPVEVRDGA